jgi:hypothetical protein
VSYPALIAAKAKWDRAAKDLKALNEDLNRFIKTEPYRFEVEFETESGWHVAYARIAEETPPALSVLVGDAAYQMLSALNLIAWELAARKVGRRKINQPEIRRDIAFPIAEKPADFESLRLLRYVSKPAIARLRGTQPYNRVHGPKGPRQHTLFLIKELADSDKHRVLAAVLGRLDAEGIAFRWDDDPAVRGPIFERLPAGDRRMVHDGTALARIRFEAGNAKAKVRVNRQPTAQVAFLSGDWSVGTVALNECLAGTAWTIRHLSPLFTGSNPFGPPGPEVMISTPG